MELTNCSIRHSLEVHTQTVNYVGSIAKGMALLCAVELRIPDAIHKHGGQPVTISQLVSELGIPQNKAECLRRLMCFLSLSNFFDVQNVNSEDAYLLTTYSAHLLSDNTNSFSIAPIVSGYSLPCFIRSWQLLGAWFRSSDSPSPFCLANGGASFWEAASRSSEINSAFNGAMTKDSQLLMSAAIEEHEEVFKELNTLVDVGGGIGYTALALAKAFPHLKCIVLDLPHVVADVAKHTTGQVEFIGGDMFDYIPPADAVLLKLVLHNWGDDDCTRILNKCKEAIPPKERGGKLIIIDIVMSLEAPQQLREVHGFFDVGMIVFNEGAKQRSEDEWKKLLNNVGFSEYKITPGLGFRSIIEAYY